MSRSLRHVWRCLWCALLVAFLVAPAASAAEDDFLLGSDAHYADDCGQFWTSVGEFETIANDGSYSAMLWFRLSQEQINSMSCVDSILELDFHTLGFSVPEEWNAYSMSTNLPGASHGKATGDDTDVANPRVLGIPVSELVAEQKYYVIVAFDNLDLNQDGTPRVSYEWVLGYWMTDAEGICSAGAVYGNSCLTETARVFLSKGYFSDDLVIEGDHVWQFP